MNGSTTEKSPQRNRTAIKMITLGVLTLLLLIPLALVSGVQHERQNRRNQAVCELSNSWGARQEVIGPILVVPYRHRTVLRREHMNEGRVEFFDDIQTTTAFAYFLPETLEVDARLDPQRLHRGIYEAVVYQGAITMTGTFPSPQLQAWGVATEDVLWDEAYVTFGIPDLRGLGESLTLDWGGERKPLLPVTAQSEIPSGVRAMMKGSSRPDDPVAFRLDIALNGSAGIRFAPVGMRNQIRISSSWTDPSFQGATLPAERRVDANGFEALWNTSHYGRSYPQAWSSVSGPCIARNDLLASLYGVDLLSMIDHYRLTERAIKYGVLFFVLVFAAFFLFEVTGRMRIHPFQYTVVGCALCLFYLALLSLSELIPFGWAYLAGAAACSGLITLYSASALRSGRRALAILGELSAIYGILYVILRLQDYSLLLGTAGLFVALAIVMYATRNLDWYAKDAE